MLARKQVDNTHPSMTQLKRWFARKLWAQALTIQVLSLWMLACVAPTVLDSTWAFELGRIGIPVETMLFWMVLHLLLVSLMAKVIEMPTWWRWIHVLFPPAVLVMMQVHLPAGLYLAGFIMTLVLYWSVHNTRVPFYPSFPATWRAMLYVCDQHAAERTMRVLDIGSGLGDVAMYLAKHRLQDHVSGIEIAPLPWLVSWLRAKLGASAARFQLGDYRQLDFAQLDVVFAYLSPAVMMDVWQKVAQEMQPGSLFVSSEFPVPGIAPSRTLFIGKHSPVIYVYAL